MNKVDNKTCLSCPASLICLTYSNASAPGKMFLKFSEEWNRTTVHIYSVRHGNFPTKGIHNAITAPKECPGLRAQKLRRDMDKIEEEDIGGTMPELPSVADMRNIRDSLALQMW